MTFPPVFGTEIGNGHQLKHHGGRLSILLGLRNVHGKIIKKADDTIIGSITKHNLQGSCLGAQGLSHSLSPALRITAGLTQL